MKLLITGATGFIGRRVVDEALRRGHRVVALGRSARPPSPAADRSCDSLEHVTLDLRAPTGLKKRLADVDAVIHLAAVLYGDREAHRSDTVAATEALLDAMVEARTDRLILVSSLSVYDYRRIPAFSVLDERSPLEARPEQREPYCWAKLRQEEIARERADASGLGLTILRPGAVVGPERRWIDALGIRLGDRLWLRFTAGSMPLPLVGVGNCADAIVTAAERPEGDGGVFNVVDDDLPTRRTYAEALRRRAPRRPLVVPLPGAWLRRLARWLAPLASRVRLPWWLDAARIETQLKPLRFSHARLSDALGWHPRASLDETLDRRPGTA